MAMAERSTPGTLRKTCSVTEALARSALSERLYSERAMAIGPASDGSNSISGRALHSRLFRWCDA
jgi:hypothetical protein